MDFIKPLYRSWLSTPHSPWALRMGPFSTSAFRHVLLTVPSKQWLLVCGILLTAMAIMLVILRTVASDGRKAFSWTVLWLVLCTVTHSWLEFQLVFSRESSIVNKAMDLYSAADFRYGRPLETGTAAMEAITAIVTGPLAALTAYAIVTEKPWRHAVQIGVSTCQLYGLAWFCMQPLFTQVEAMTTDPLLFWLIAVGLNAPWGIVPPILIAKSVKEITRMFEKEKTVITIELNSTAKIENSENSQS